MWQIKEGNKVYYLDPEKNNLLLLGCKLFNNSNISKKIFNGEDKRVCSWISCKKIKIIKQLKYCQEIKYNPRQNIHWTDEKGLCIDGKEFKYLFTFKNKIYSRFDKS